jgi:hypothetical protein
LHLFEIDQPQVCFVDERCRLKRVAWPFPGHLSPRQPSQLLVDDRNELLQRGLVAVFPSGEETRDGMARHIDHGISLEVRRGNAFYQHQTALPMTPRSFVRAFFLAGRTLPLKMSSERRVGTERPLFMVELRHSTQRRFWSGVS